MILEKNVRFNNKDWLVNIENGVVTLFLFDNEGNKKQVYYGSIYGKNIIEQCKNAVLRANDILFPIDELEEFNNWDGNLDKLTPPKTGSGIK